MGGPSQMGQTIKRVWKRSDTEIQSNELMSIWDSGNIRFERAIGLKEVAWAVLDRNETEDGFEETLVENPLYCTPANFTWKEVVPFEAQKNGFLIPGWSVTWVPANSENSRR